MAWMILGPTKWGPGNRPSPLTRGMLDPHLPPGWEPPQSPRPIDVRAAAKGILRNQGRLAVLMEEHETREKESNTDLFHRVRQEAGVTRFMVYWPAGAQRTGLDWELGILTSEISQNNLDPDRILLLVQEAAASIRTDSGELESHERGQRTRYYNDLVQHGCPFALWRDHAGFLDAVQAWASPSFEP